MAIVEGEIFALKILFFFLSFRIFYNNVILACYNATFFLPNNFLGLSNNYVTRIWFKLKTHKFDPAHHFWPFSRNSILRHAPGFDRAHHIYEFVCYTAVTTITLSVLLKFRTFPCPLQSTTFPLGQGCLWWKPSCYRFRWSPVTSLNWSDFVQGWRNYLFKLFSVISVMVFQLKLQLKLTEIRFFSFSYFLYFSVTVSVIFFIF